MDIILAASALEYAALLVSYDRMFPMLQADCSCRGTLYPVFRVKTD